MLASPRRSAVVPMLRHGRPSLWANRESSRTTVAGCFGYPIWIIANWPCSTASARQLRAASMIDKTVLRTDWRAPLWVQMEPNGNAFYDATVAWERMNESETKDILRYLREDRWILLLQSTAKEIAGVAYETLAKRRASSKRGPEEEKPSAPVKAPERVELTRMPKALMLKYRSGIKRAILGALTKNPTATDAEVCRSLDAEGGENLPLGWKIRKEDRSFFAAYAIPSTKRKIEIAISKIRRDLRDRGLLQ